MRMAPRHSKKSLKVLSETDMGRIWDCYCALVIVFPHVPFAWIYWTKLILVILLHVDT